MIVAVSASTILAMTSTAANVHAASSASPSADLRADRLRALPPFLFNAIDDKKRAAIAAGKDVINLGVGDPDQPTPQFVIDQLAKAASDPANHQYPDCYGTPRFLQAAAEFMRRRFGVKVDPKRHLCATIGGKDGISHLPLGLLNPGDGAIVFTPAYPVYAQASLMAGATLHRIACDAAHDWRPDLSPSNAQLAAALSGSRLMWLNFPGNPTGACADTALLTRAASLCRDHAIVLASDLAYSEIYFDSPDSVPSLLQAPGVDIERDDVIEFHSLSKTFNMTGWRLGFAVGSERVIKALKQTKDNYDSGPFNAIQAAGAMALERFDDPLLAAMRAQYAQRRDIALAGLRAIGCEVTPPHAGIFVWARCPIDSTTGSPMSSWAFVERLIDEAGVVTVPGAGFAPTAQDWFRVSLTRQTPRLAEAMARLGSLRF
jgi:LL-diaminopimelate aminotransferase